MKNNKRNNTTRRNNTKRKNNQIKKSKRVPRITFKKKGGRDVSDYFIIRFTRNHTNSDITPEYELRTGPNYYKSKDRAGYLINYLKHVAKNTEEMLAQLNKGPPKLDVIEKKYKIKRKESDVDLEPGGETPLACKKKTK